jgi:hypothetical protein
LGEDQPGRSLLVESLRTPPEQNILCYFLSIDCFTTVLIVALWTQADGTNGGSNTRGVAELLTLVRKHQCQNTRLKDLSLTPSSSPAPWAVTSLLEGMCLELWVRARSDWTRMKH